MAKSEFGRRLKEIFDDATNQKIADKLGKSAPAIQHYVDGRVPNVETLLRISEVTNCNLHWLLTGDGPKHQIGLVQPDQIFSLSALERRMREIVREELQQIPGEEEENLRGPLQPAEMIRPTKRINLHDELAEFDKEKKRKAG